MSAPDRPTREQVDTLRAGLRAALDEVDHPNQITVDQDALIEILDRLDEQDAGHAAEVRALRAEQERVHTALRHESEAHVAERERLRAELRDALDVADRLRSQRDKLHQDVDRVAAELMARADGAALAARTPQPAGLEPNHTHLKMTGTAGVLTVWRIRAPGGTPHVAHRIDVDPRCLTLSWANGARPRATVEHVPDCRCGDLSGRLTVASPAPLPAVPDGEDAAIADRARHLDRYFGLWVLDDKPWDEMSHEEAYKRGQVFATRYIARRDAAPVAEDGEDVPARLDAAADAIDEHNPYSCAGGNLRSIAVSLRLSSPELRAAVAAALARPTEPQR